MQGLLAVHAAGGAVSRALAYLRRRQQGDGSVAYSTSSTQTPVWVTAQALMALRRVSLPIATVARAPQPKPKASPAPSGAAAAPAGQEKKPAPAHPARKRKTPAGQGIGGGAGSPRAGSTGVPSAAEPGKPTGIVVDRERDDSGGGVSPWLVVAAVVAVLALLVPFRRRLLGLARRPSTD